jgi:hypothetical protein
MQAVCEIIAAFVTALASAAFAQFGVALEAPAEKTTPPEVRRTVTAAPAAETKNVCVRPNQRDCPERRVKAA